MTKSYIVKNVHNSTVIQGENNRIDNIESYFEHGVKSINSLALADKKTKVELLDLFEKLQAELHQSPKDMSEQIEAVAEAVKVLAETIAKPNPNKSTIQINADGLKKAAENLAVVMPTVLIIAAQIIKAVFVIFNIRLP